MTSSELDSIEPRLYIDGRWCESTDGETFDVENPATGRTLASVASAGPADVLAAVDAAGGAGPGWATTAPRERGEVLRRAFEIMTQEVERFAEIVVLENGKSLADARAEILYAAEFFRWYGEEAVRMHGRVGHAPGGGNRIIVVQQPVGVALLITPWNFPAAMVTRKVGPALAVGCTVVLKPASPTPLTSLALAEVLQRAGAPRGVVNVVPALHSAEVVEPMLAHPDVRKLSFTGSTPVGRALLAQAAERVTNCSMELGGNAPFIVFADADLDRAIEGAIIAKMRNGGASCVAANRFLVQEPVADEFSRRLAEAMGALRVGPGMEKGTQVGPMVSETERDKIASLVEGGVDDGGKVLTGGRVPDREGWFYPPTVLADVPPDSILLHEEVFGPVAPVASFHDAQEAVRMANDTEYGLAAYVFSSDLARGLAVCEALESGMVGFNRGLISDPAAPFGGVKQSGLGREGGHEGLAEFCETKYIAAEW